MAHVEQRSQSTGHGLEKPDMDDGRRELDMAHALASNARVRDLDAAAVADHALELHAAVLAAGALPIFLGPEDALAEEPVLFRTIGAVVDGLRLLHFAERPAPDVVRTGKPNFDGCVIVDTIVGTFAHAHDARSLVFSESPSKITKARNSNSAASGRVRNPI